MVFPCKEDEAREGYALHGHYVEAETAINVIDKVPHLSLHIEINDKEHNAKRQFRERILKFDEHYDERSQRDVQAPKGPSVFNPYEGMGQHKDCKPMNNRGMAHGTLADERRSLYVGQGCTSYDPPEPHRNIGYLAENACHLKKTSFNKYAPNDRNEDTGFCKMCSTPTAFVCQRCYVVHYCSKLCQETDWPQHKGVCQAIPSLVKKMPPAVASNVNVHVAPKPRYQEQHQHPTKCYFHQHTTRRQSPPRCHNNQQHQQQQRNSPSFNEAPQCQRSSANGGDSYDNMDFRMDGVSRERQELVARYLVDERNARETYYKQQQQQQQKQPQQHRREKRSARVNNSETYPAGPTNKRPRYEERVSDNVKHSFRQPAEYYAEKKRSDVTNLLHASNVLREQADYLQAVAYAASKERVPRVVGHQCPRAVVETTSAPCWRSTRE